MDESTNTLLQSHEARLQGLEDIGRDNLALLVRMETKLDGKLHDIQDDLTALRSGLARVEVTAQVATDQDRLRDLRVDELEEAADASKARRSAVLKWIAGVGSALVVAALSILLGIK